MSMKLMVQAMNCKVGDSTRKLILIKLADNANDRGECFPSYQHIADQCECSRRTVISHIDRLIADGFVSKKARKNKDGSMSNLYFLHLERGGENSALGGENSAPGGSENFALGGENSAPGGGENFAPRTSHSFEPVKEPNTTLTSCNARAKKSTAKDLLGEFGITGQLADDFITHRKSKKAPITQTVLKSYQREADKAGIPLAEAIEISIERNWQGFRASWQWRDDSQQNQQPRKMSYSEMNALPWNRPEDWVGVF